MPITSKIRFKTEKKYVDISLCHLCVVGESHDWNSVYDNCEKCYQTSLEFASLLRDPPGKRKVQLDEFVAHWNSKHL